MNRILSANDIPPSCLLKFGAEWCAPCRAIKPVLDRVASSTGVTIVDVDIDESPELVETFGVRGVPTVFAIKDGKTVDMIVGAVGESKFLEMAQKTK